MISCHTKKQFLWKKFNPRKKKKKKLLLIFHFQKLSFNSEISSMCGRRKKSFHLNHFHSIPFRAELAKRRFEGNNNERPSLVLVFYRCSIIFDKKLLFMNMEWLVACGWLFIGLNMGVWVPTSLSLILESLEKLFLAHLRREKKWHGEKKSLKSLSLISFPLSHCLSLSVSLLLSGSLSFLYFPVSFWLCPSSSFFFSLSRSHSLSRFFLSFSPFLNIIFLTLYSFYLSNFFLLSLSFFVSNFPFLPLFYFFPLSQCLHLVIYFFLQPFLSLFTSFFFFHFSVFLSLPLTRSFREASTHSTHYTLDNEGILRCKADA